ncbi:hypothetical protein [Rhodopseudomonas sp. B29]|uniref:hypothetical protein n=1 Tax=Rhodopseudomonas sp. B29 TaxID=95607 RepID=UPI000344CEB8|nr:hypothetical protein [Rhodopseudomonas sp. B29]
MAGKSNEPSEVSVERARRKLMAQQEGQTRMAEIQRESVAVRSNMARLRELRLAKEAEMQADAAAAPQPRKAAKARKR